MMRKLLLGILAVALAGNVTAQSLDFGHVKSASLPYVGVKSTSLSQVKNVAQAKNAKKAMAGKKYSSRLQWVGANNLKDVQKNMKIEGVSMKRNNSTVYAADAPLSWWGYPSVGEWGAFGFDLLAQGLGVEEFKGQTDYNVACIIPGTYEKAKIDSVEFIILGGKKYEDLTVWVSPFSTVEEEGETYISLPLTPNDAAVKAVVPADDINRVTSDKLGYVGVKLPVAFSIPAEGCFVGYAFNGKSDEKPIVITYTVGNDGGLLMKCTYKGLTDFMDFSAMGLGDLTVQIGMDVSDCDANSASVMADAEQTVMLGAANNYNFYIANNGAKEITSIDYIITEDGVAGNEGHLELSQPIAAADYAVLPLANKVFDTEGVHTLELTVTKVNGNNNIAEDNTAANSIIVLEKAAERVSVVEEMTGTWCGWCPRGHVALENMKKTFGDKVITLASHYSYSSDSPDPMNCYLYDQSDQYGNYGVVADLISQYLGGGGFPGAIFDRMIWADPYQGLTNKLNEKGTIDYGGDNLINAMRLAIPSEADLKLSANWDDDAKTAIKVDVSATFNYDRFGENPYGVGFVLSENGMKGAGTSWMQFNYYSESYNQSGTSYWKNADMLSWFDAEVFVPMEYNNVVVQSWRPLGDGQFTKDEEIVKGQAYDASFTLPLSSDLIQDKDMLSLTAILVNLNSLGIVNAAQVHLGAGAAGITDVQKDADSNVVERYNLNGMRMNAPQKGLNIVRLADGRCVKVAVK